MVGDGSGPIRSALGELRLQPHLKKVFFGSVFFWRCLKNGPFLWEWIVALLVGAIYYMGPHRSNKASFVSTVSLGTQGPTLARRAARAQHTGVVRNADDT